MQATPKFDRFVKIQNQFFERVHTESCELKPLGYEMKKKGINTSKLYCNPEYILLPFEECEYLAQLTSKQLSIITACFYAMEHARTLNLESITLTWNLKAAEVFPAYSEEYMVLFQETNEEYDHMVTFNNISQGFLGRKVDQDYYARRQYRLQVLEGLVKEFRGEKLPVSAFYLVNRFIQNLMVKQSEGFMFNYPDKYEYDDLAKRLTFAHSNDEARHFTTSFDLGSYLYHQCDKTTRKGLRLIFNSMMVDNIVESFGTAHFRNYIYPLSLDALKEAMQNPLFGDFPINFEGLTKSWEEKKIKFDIEKKTVFLESQKWVASQYERLIDELDLRFNLNLVLHDYGEMRVEKKDREIAYDHYKNFLAS